MREVNPARLVRGVYGSGWIGRELGQIVVFDG
jgi:hypothetical protein